MRYASGDGRVDSDRSSRAVYISRAIRAGYAVVEVREVGRWNRRCAERQIVSVVVPSVQ